MILKIALAALSVALTIHAQNVPDSAGTEFFLNFFKNIGEYGTSTNYEIHISAQHEGESFNVFVSGGMTGIYVVSHSQVTRISVPENAVWIEGESGQVLGKSIKLTADKEFKAYGLNTAPGSTDAYLAYPTDVLGKDYILSTPSITSVGHRNQFAAISIIENTKVDVFTNTDQLWNSTSLGRGQSIAFWELLDFSGYRIVSSEPIVVMAGNECAYVPDKNCCDCDHVVQMIPPTNVLGVSYVVGPLSEVKLNLIKITANNDTTMNYTDSNGLHSQYLRRQETVQLTLDSSAPLVLAADNPVLVVEYATGSDCNDGIGDPFMMVIPPTNLYSSIYTVFALPNFTNYFNFVIEETAINGLRINGQPLADGVQWLRAGMTNLMTTNYSVGEGSFLVENIYPDTLFLVSVYGWAAQESYGYAGGMLMTNNRDFCSPTIDSNPPDGVDNDCDGRVDEEIFNGRDDDDDGRIDEDLATEVPRMSVPSNFENFFCDFDRNYENTNITGEAKAIFVAPRCVGQTNISFTDEILSSSNCSITVSRLWHLTDACGNQINKTQGRVHMWQPPDVYEWPADMTVDSNQPITPTFPNLKEQSCAGIRSPYNISYRDSQVGDVINRRWTIEFCEPVDTVTHIQLITINRIPVIGSLSPTSGSRDGGFLLELEGADFPVASSFCLIGNESVPAVRVSDELVRCAMEEQRTSGIVQIRVKFETEPTEKLSNSLPFDFTNISCSNIDCHGITGQGFCIRGFTGNNCETSIAMNE